MGFKSAVVVLGTSDTLIFECPATFSGGARLVISNKGAAAQSYTLKFYKQSTDETTVIANAFPIATGAPKSFGPIAMEAGDQILGSCAASGTDVVVTATIAMDTSSSPRALNPRGEFDIDATYGKNDLVSKAGVGSFISMVEDNTGNDPESSPSAWMVNSPKGDPGATGASGASGLTIVRCVSTGVTAPSGFTVGASIDGVTLVQNDLVLRASSTNPELNGIYSVPASGTPARNGNFSAYDSYPGVYFSVLEGTANADTLWRCTSNKGGTIDVTALTMNKFTSGIAGPVSSTDNAAARMDGTGGDKVQDSALLIADTTGALSRSGGGGIPVQGTNTNDAAAPGYVGEYISSTVAAGSAVSLTTATAANITSISLPAGDWDVWANVLYTANAATAISVITGWVSAASATFPTADPNGGAFNVWRGSLTGQTTTAMVMPVGMMRISVSSATTVYLSTLTVFSANTLAAYGFIGARRVR